MKERASNIELFRGVLMLMIVLVHLTGNGVLSAENPIDYHHRNWILANLIDSICYPAVNSFIIISGYFGIRLTSDKIFKMEIPIIIYGILAIIFTPPPILSNISGGTVVQSLFPFLSKSYWFYTGYILLMIVSPIINSFIDNNKDHLLICLFVGSLLFVLIPSFSFFRLAEPRGMDFINFTLLYIIGRFISVNKINIKIGWALTTYVISTAIIFFSTIYLAYKFGINKGWQSPFYSYNFILVVIQSLTLFFVFKNINLRSRIGKIVNFLSPSFFFVYIIHESPLVHKNLYSWLNIEDYYYADNFIYHTLLSAILIFIVCMSIDIVVRRYVFKRMIDKIIIIEDKFFDKFMHNALLFFNNNK